jgi:hypothetical protein
MAPKKATTLKIENCVATAATVKVYFSEPLDISQVGGGVGTDDPNLTGNYTVSNLSSSTPQPVITRGVSENARRVTQAAEDAVAYPIMTEQVGLPPSSSYANGNGGGGGGGYAGGGRQQIGQTATQAIADVLGWKLNDNDPKGFVGALAPRPVSTREPKMLCRVLCLC